METRATARIEGDTIVHAFRINAARISDRPALRRRSEGAWETLTWSDYGRRVAEVGAGLVNLGVEPGDRVAILSGNRLDWHLADLGTLCVGGISVPLYPTSSAEQVAYLLGNAEARTCFVENHDQLAKVLEVRERLPKLELVVVLDDGATRFDDPFVLGLSEVAAVGAARLLREPEIVDARAGAVTPEQPATLVYTSGTTGPPKGAVITHANVMWTLRSAVSLLDIREGERFLSFLPLSHIAERMISDFASVALGGDTWFARSLATVPEDLRECRPTVFFAVPRVWEKFHEAVVSKLGAEHGLKRIAIERYVTLGERLVAAHAGAGHAPLRATLPYEALDAVVGARIRHELGLDQAHLLVTAAAPIHPGLLRWFHAIGLPVIELYGQTETCGPTTCNHPDDNQIGTVGRPIPGVRVRIADDGEVLVKGGNVCAGYWRDRKGTAELIDGEGWMHSGDMGSVDEGGCLRITGRKKDLIITAAGQNIAPQEIETDLRNHELISEAVVVGDGRRYLTALITLNATALAAWAQEHSRVADYETLVGDPDVRAEVDRIVEEVNALRSRVERIRRYRILATDFTIAAGELTPTQKVKRNAVNAEYRELIEEMYAEEEA